MVYRTWRFSTPIDDPYKKTRLMAGLFFAGDQWDSTRRKEQQLSRFLPY